MQHRRPLPQAVTKKKIPKYNLDSENNGVKLDPETYSVPEMIPHHFIMMHAFRRKQNRSECWVCSHMGTGRHSVPMVGRPVTLEQLLNVTQEVPIINTTTINKPLLFTGYIRKPQFCFLNGAGKRLYNGKFCRGTQVNLTMLNLPLALNGTIDIEGLVTFNIPDPDERVGNASLYDITKCVRGPENLQVTEWINRTHMDSIPSLGDWMCLVGLRSRLSPPKVVQAPHVPQGWMVCCGLWCHTTIPFPMDRKTSGWCTLVEMIPFMGTTGTETPVSMIPAHGHLEFGRHKRGK